MINNNDFCVIIPARLNSSRLPNKVILDINGVPMLIRVVLQAQKSKAKNVFVATDNEKIINICRKYNVNYFLTSNKPKSGTERIVEVVKKNHINENIIINVQADEPLINPKKINHIANHILKNKTPMATIASYINNENDLMNSNIVKLVIDNFKNAVYFSRSSIPFNRSNFEEYKKIYLKHIGVYAYEKSFLYNYNKLKISQIEKMESLEQLRVLYNGFKISVLTIKEDNSLGVDTLEDLNNVKNYLNNFNKTNRK